MFHAIIAKALYDWTAQAPDEHSLSAGETVTISKGGEAFADGWFEVIKDGRKGIVPSNYVRFLLLSLFFYRPSFFLSFVNSCSLCVFLCIGHI